ncbi:MAG: LamG domain-containing protein [Actinomycetia bacterium]|nr:LamG domain-containing protein [Actinomycetes bacterium]
MRLRRPHRPVLIASAAAGLLLAVALPANAAVSTVALYEMNEPAGARTMVDSSGNGLNGSIGAAVQTGVAYGGAVGYRWSDVKPNEPPAKPERLVLVPDNDKLDPGTSTYTVTVRYRTLERFGNIIQKGQSATVGGYFKFQAPKGIVKCLFKGSNGEQRTASSKVPLNDGNWHTVTCKRTATQVSMWVDGVVTSRANGPTGSISNKKPLAIGGKATCDQVTITCDYFEGDIDYVKIEKG